MIKIIKNNSGFTLIELIAVIIVTGIISAILVSRFYFSDIDLISQTEVLKTHLRYAQAKAMNDDNDDAAWGISCDGSSYWLYRNGNESLKVLIPGEYSGEIVLSDKGISVDSFNISFNKMGKPFNSGQPVEGEDKVLTISAGSENKTIIITKNTGFIR